LSYNLGWLFNPWQRVGEGGIKASPTLISQNVFKESFCGVGQHYWLLQEKERKKENFGSILWTSDEILVYFASVLLFFLSSVLSSSPTNKTIKFY